MFADEIYKLVIDIYSSSFFRNMHENDGDLQLKVTGFN